MTNSEKSIVLHPSWKNYFLLIILGIILAPLLVGIVLLWLAYYKRTNTQFLISDHSIVEKQKSESKKVELVDINETRIVQSSWEKFLKIGNIHLQANVSEIVLEGISEPQSLLDKIDTAIAYQKELLNQKKSLERKEPQFDPGSLDKLDQLTGMWQQGLISDEDFEEERKKFS